VPKVGEKGMPVSMWPMRRREQAGPTPATVVSAIAAASIAVVAGALAAGAVPLPETLRLSSVALLLGAIFIAALPLLLHNWRAAALVFIAWLLVEDLFRKLAGNDLTIYFAKDVLYAVLLVAMAADPTFRGAWRTATGGVRWWLYALIAWAVVMSVPTGLQDWRLPLIGLRLDFLYVPLVALGYQMARRAREMQRWLVRLAILGAAASAVGIVQSIVGPSFLAPTQPTPGLGHLVLIRGLPQLGMVYRPTGTFVDPGRFVSVALVALAVGLGAVLTTKGRMRLWASVATLCSAGAVWVSGGRAGFLAGLALVAIAALGTALTQSRPVLGKTAAVAGIAIASFILLAAVQPNLFHSRLLWYQRTLDPGSQENEWLFRWDAYGGDTLRGVALGEFIGQGTGQESLGKQYLYGGSERSPIGLYEVEGGYAAVAVEWGIVGLALWIGWTVAWARRQWQAVRMARGSPAAAAGLVFLGWMLFFLFLRFFTGLQAFQDYIANAYFWLLSGVIFALPEAARHRQEDGPAAALASGSLAPSPPEGRNRALRGRADRALAGPPGCPPVLHEG
jgi:hypothetical protein